jgi:O-antigen ligase
VSLGFKFHPNFRLDMIGVQKVIIYGGTIFGLICIYLYGENLGQVSRLTYKTNISDYSVVNPIRLAYFSSIFIGVSMINFIKLGNVDRIIALFTIVFNTVILILSASRGPFISLIFSLALLFFVNNKTKYLIFAVPLVMLLLSLLSDYSTRLTNLSINTVVDDQERIPRYFDSLNSFENSPIIGSSMKMNSYDGYPHNIFIEFLQMTGLLGTTLFLIILSVSFLNMKSFCFRYNSFIPFIFLFSLINLQVSGSFLTAQLFWISTSILYFTNAYSTDI